MSWSLTTKVVIFYLSSTSFFIVLLIYLGQYCEPICFARRQPLVGTAYILNAYQTLHKLFMWMGIDSHALLYGLDHVQQVCNKINKI